MHGYALYEIEFNNPIVTTPRSELKYPVNLFLLTASLSWNLSDETKLQIILKGSISTNTGIFEDYDWGIYYYDFQESWASPTSLDCYSTAETTLGFYSIEGSLIVEDRVDSPVAGA